MEVEGSNVIVLDSGSVFDNSPGSQPQIKAEVALEAMEMMSYNIFNFGNTDFTFGVDFLLNYSNQFNIPTINANIVYEDTGENITAPSKIIQVNNIEVGFIGIVSQDFSSEILLSNNINSRNIAVLDEVNALQAEINNIKNDVDIIIVLAYVGIGDSIAIANSVEGIDVIICGHNSSEESLLTVNGVYIVKAGYQGKAVGKLDLSFDESNNLNTAEGNIISLTPTIQEDIQVAMLIDEYHDRLEAIKDELLNIEQIAPDSGGYYTGYSTCAVCHSSQTNQWNATNHAIAFTSLIEMSQEYNPECFDCHTNGFGYIGGFVMSDTTPELEGVQCEMCHGAGGDHSASPSSPFGHISESTCTKCHTQERSPDFKFATYYPETLHVHPQGDYDNDTISDVADNCWEAFNPDQEDEDSDGLGDACDDCTDVDGDGYGYPRFPDNSCLLDNCPDVSNPDQTDVDSDELGDMCDSCPNDPHNDVDSDGVCGDTDNCPEVANPNQEDGDSDGLGNICDNCMDTDGDGFGNPGFPNNSCILDNCPEMTNPDQIDSDGDCMGEVCDPFPDIYDPAQADSDGDGLGDLCDNCPYNDNFGQEDSDLDGVGDVCDNCTNDHNYNQEDTYPPQTNNCGDACECEGDFDEDHDVDGTDAASFKIDFGRSGFNNPCESGDTCDGDFDCDADVDGTDATLFKSDFGRSGFSNPCPVCEMGEWCIYP